MSNKANNKLSYAIEDSHTICNGIYNDKLKSQKLCIHPFKQRSCVSFVIEHILSIKNILATLGFRKRNEGVFPVKDGGYSSTVSLRR